MALDAHMHNLEKRKAHLEYQIEGEFMRPLPDFAKVTQLKKKKLRINDQLSRLGRGAAAA
jgi:hypothetical protein